MIKNIALIAHDQKKPQMAEFLKERQDWIATVNLLATGRTAESLEKAGVQIKHLSPARTGGYRELIELISEGKLDMVFFFLDPDVERPYHSDIEELLDLCINKNIPFGTNRASAELLILGLIKYRSYEAHKNS